MIGDSVIYDVEFLTIGAVRMISLKALARELKLAGLYKDIFPTLVGKCTFGEFVPLVEVEEMLLPGRDRAEIERIGRFHSELTRAGLRSYLKEIANAGQRKQVGTKNRKTGSGRSARKEGTNRSSKA